MSIVRTIKSYLVGGEEVSRTTYECTECGRVFESAKRPDRATCMECLSTNVERRG